MLMAFMAITAVTPVDIPSWLATIRPDQVALGTLVTIMVLGLLRGWVVPRSVLVDRMTDLKEQNAALAVERDAWKEAYTQGELARQKLVQQNTELIDAGQTTNRLMDSLRSHLEKS